MKKKPIYGINTGFGSLCNTEIAENELQDLQENLLKSHACGMGDEVPEDIVRLMLILKAQSLSKGFSGVHLNTVQLLIECYNRGISPVVYELGSLGASGDLAPLANMSLALIGIGEVYYNGKKTTASKALESAGLTALRLEAKEGLALINGTQFMQAYGAYCIYQSDKEYPTCQSNCLPLIGCVQLQPISFPSSNTPNPTTSWSKARSGICIRKLERQPNRE